MTEHQPSSAGISSPAGRARIIRREPTGTFPAVPDRPIPPSPSSAQPARATSAPEPSAAIPIAASAVAIIGGWPASVVATDLITSWWHSDRLFCVAVGFLSLVFAATTICGVILLLRRHSLGRYLIAIGAVVALLTFGSLFIAGAQIPRIVHLIPVLQITSAVLALHPATKRWLPPG